MAGGVVGVVNTVTRWWTVARLRTGRESHALLATLGGLALRLALVSALLAVGFRHSVTSGLLCFAGLWLIRSAGLIYIHSHDVYWPPLLRPVEHD
jgi:hypothetical protein